MQAHRPRAAVSAVLSGMLGLTLLTATMPIGSAAPDGGEGYLDLHVHTAGIGAGGSGAFIAESLRDSFKFEIYLRAFGVSLEEVERGGDGIIIERIATGVADSRRVSRAVVLALDGVVDAEGELDRDRTEIYVPNELVAAETGRFDQLLFGASVNPYRADALARLDAVKAAGAVLVKWIPGTMRIDPADPALGPFYRRLRELDLPLLTHGGQERSFGASDDALNDPRRLALALDLGVTVIVAHLASTGWIDGRDPFEHLLPMLEAHERLYADIAALTQVNRRGYLFRALERSEVRERLIYGSDWPLQFFPLVSGWYHFPRVSTEAIRAIGAIENPWDRDVALKEAMGVPEEVFARGNALLFPERGRLPYTPRSRR